MKYAYGSRLENHREHDGRTHADQTDLYKKLGLTGGLKKFGHLEDVADNQAETEGKEDIGDAPFAQKGLFRDDHGDKREEKDDKKTGDVILQVKLHEDAGDKCHGTGE